MPWASGNCWGIWRKSEKVENIVHGKQSLIFHNKKTIFQYECPLSAGRYHSLCAFDLPECLKITVKTKEGIIMAVRHKKYFVEGSILSWVNNDAC